MISLVTPAIIVFRDVNLRDESVFTGRMTLQRLDPLAEFLTGTVFALPERSPHIEHAFVFPGHGRAHIWLDRMRLSDDGFWKSWRVVVREDGDFHPGDVVHRRLERPTMMPTTSAPPRHSRDGNAPIPRTPETPPS